MKKMITRELEAEEVEEAASEAAEVDLEEEIEIDLKPKEVEEEEENSDNIEMRNNMKKMMMANNTLKSFTINMAKELTRRRILH